MVIINDSELNKLRKKIDILDKDILAALEKRYELILDVAKLKKRKNYPVRDLSREKELIYKKMQMSKKLPEDFIKKVYQLIIDESAKAEEKLK